MGTMFDRIQRKEPRSVADGRREVCSSTTANTPNEEKRKPASSKLSAKDTCPNTPRTLFFYASSQSMAAHQITAHYFGLSWRVFVFGSFFSFFLLAAMCALSCFVRRLVSVATKYYKRGSTMHAQWRPATSIRTFF